MKDSNDSGLDPRHGATVEFVVDYLRHGILSGQFAPGQRLVLRDLVEDIGISRGPLREAFRRLSADGLIELMPNRGAAVRRFSRTEIENIFKIREVLEGLAASLAAWRITQSDNHARFAKLWDSMKEHNTIPSDQRFIEENRSLHRMIVKLSGNPQLASLVDQMALPVVMFQLRRLMSPEDIANSIQEHTAIADAILSGDSKKAESAMRNHLRKSAARFMKFPPSAFKG